MIEIEFRPDDLVAMRFAYSPLVELVASYTVLMHKKRSLYHQKWREEATTSLRGVELPYMSALFAASKQSFCYIADFLTPTPTSTRHTFAGEMERLRAIPHDIVRRNILQVIDYDENNDVRQHFLQATDEAMEKLIEELIFYWHTTLAHHWQNMKTILENDVLFRARQLALSGIDDLFTNLNKFVTYQQRTLILHKSTSNIADYKPTANGLQLVPGIFSAPGVLVQFSPDWQPMLIYAARGTGLWNQPPAEQFESLELTIGEGKARILQALLDPTNTGELARKLNVTAGAISQHLSRLSEAGLVEAHRSGNRVYYRLSDRGERLLEVFS